MRLAKYSPVPAVYFLQRNKRIVYVGKTVRLAERLAEHLYLFDECFYLEVLSAQDRSRLEKLFIRLLKPELNRRNWHGVCRTQSAEKVASKRGQSEIETTIRLILQPKNGKLFFGQNL